MHQLVVQYPEKAKTMANNPITSQRDPIPDEFSSLAEAGEFWDTHSTADYEDLMEDVSFEINLPPQPMHSYAIAKDLATQLHAVAKQQGISTQTLINLWLQEKLLQATR